MGEESTALVPYEKELKALRATGKKNDFYKVGNTNQPSARVLQQWANHAGISTEIIKIYRDDKMAYAIVRGWTGKKECPDITHDEAVEIYFDDYLADWLFKKTKTGMRAGLDERGVPMPSEPKDKQRMAEFIFRKKMFALREAITKAQKRIYLKILSVEWRDPEEIEGEAEEMETVDESFNPSKEEKKKPAKPPKPIADAPPAEYNNGVSPEEIQALTEKLGVENPELTTREKAILMDTVINSNSKTGKFVKRISKTDIVVNQNENDIEMLWNVVKKKVMKDVAEAKSKVS